MTVLFSDIDGTLIDHHTYDTGLASEAVALLRKKNIPLVFCSSKTFAEQAWLQQKLGIKFPMIVENGSGIVIPEGYFPNQTIASEPLTDGYRLIRLSTVTWQDIRNILRQTNQALGASLRGFADASDEELSIATNLKGADLERARQRMFTETLLPPPPNEVEMNALTRSGLAYSQGGRFVTLTGDGINKGRGLKVLAGWYAKESASTPIIVAIGDSPNDHSMLSVADNAYLVQRPGGTWATMDIPGLVRIDGVGPKGFLDLAKRL